jgi:hypothetical protein
MLGLTRTIMQSKIGLLAIALIGILLVVLFGGIPHTTYRSGWELKTELVAIDHRGTMYTSIPEYTEEHQEGHGSFGDDYPRTVLGPALWEFDLDHPDYGLPDVQIVVSDVRVNEGTWPYADLEQVFEGYMYSVTYREYIFDVQVRTVADSKLVSASWYNYGNIWHHETACPYGFASISGQGAREYTGKEFVGAVYVRFAIHPFGLPDFGEPPEGYTFTSYWAGIMNAKLEGKDMGKVATGTDLREDHVGWVRGLPSDGSQLNMYLDDGAFVRGYSEVPWDANKVLDPDIHSVVIIQLPFQLMAGAYENYGAWEYGGYGAINNLVPIDYYFTTTVRMETFIVKELTSREPVGPVNPSPVKSPEDFYPVPMPGFWATYGLYILIAVIVIIAIVVVVTLFGGLPFLGFLFGIFRFRKGLYGGEYG